MREHVLACCALTTNNDEEKKQRKENKALSSAGHSRYLIMYILFMNIKKVNGMIRYGFRKNTAVR